MDSVSVIIPCYLQAEYLGEAIESALAQSRPPDEIVVVDDGSPDGTAEVVHRYPSVQYLRQDNRGLPAARNAGIRASSGSYLVFLDADDHLLPNHLERNMQGFQERPDAGLVCGDYRWFGASDTWHVHNCTPDPDHYGTLLQSNFIGPPHVGIFRRKVILDLGGFREELRTCEDRDLYLRLARRCPIYCHHEVVAEYRRHGMQMSRNWEAMLRYGLAVLRAQRPHVARNPQYREAYRRGISNFQRDWGEPIAWTMVRAARTGHWASASRACMVLLRHHPYAFVRLLEYKMTALLHSEKPAA